MKDVRKEVATLRLLAEGHTSRSIASILGVSPKTIEHRLEIIRSKYGAKNAAHLIHLAHKANLLNR